MSLSQTTDQPGIETYTHSWPSCLPKYLWFTFPYKDSLIFQWTNMLPLGGGGVSNAFPIRPFSTEKLELQKYI